MNLGRWWLRPRWLACAALACGAGKTGAASDGAAVQRALGQIGAAVAAVYGDATRAAIVGQLHEAARELRTAVSADFRSDAELPAMAEQLVKITDPERREQFDTRLQQVLELLPRITERVRVATALPRPPRGAIQPPPQNDKLPENSFETDSAEAGDPPMMRLRGLLPDTDEPAHPGEIVTWGADKPAAGAAEQAGEAAASIPGSAAAGAASVTPEPLEPAFSFGVRPLPPAEPLFRNELERAEFFAWWRRSLGLDPPLESPAVPSQLRPVSPDGKADPEPSTELRRAGRSRATSQQNPPALVR